MTDKVEAPKAEEPAKNPLEKSVSFTVSAAELKKGMDAELKRIAKKAKMPGFRPGHVPFAHIQAAYGQEAYTETLNKLIGEAYDKAVREAKLAVAGIPNIKGEPPKSADADLEFTATVECYPEFDLPDFSAVELKKYTCVVDDAAVAKTLDVMIKQRATYEADEKRQAAAEDKVTINFKGTKDGVAFDGGSAEGFVFVLNQGRMLPEFEAAVTGLAAGEKKTFKLTFPQDYGAKDLAGQEVEFEVEVTKVEKPVYPAVDDAFAKTLGLDSADALRAEIRKNLEREVKARVLQKTKTEVMDAVNAACTFALPKAVVADEQRAMAETAKRDMAARGLDVKKMKDLPLELFADGAARRVRLGLFAAKLIEAEKLEASEADVKAIVEEMASAYEKPEEMVETVMKDRAQVAQFYNIATENKVVEWVLSKAKTTETALEFDKLMTGAEA